MSRRTEIEVGLTVLLAVGILLWGVTWLKEYQLHRRVRVWHVMFPQTGGLGASDEVQVNGIRKGAVAAMKLSGDKVLVDLSLSSEITLTRDSQVSIRNVGLMGEKVIAIDLRSSGGAYSERDTIAGIYEKGVPEVMATLGETVDAITQLAHDLRAMAEMVNTKQDLKRALANFRSGSEELAAVVRENRASLRTAVTNFAEASRVAKGLTADREAQLKTAIDNFAQAADRVNRLTVRLDTLRNSMQSVAGKIDRGEGSLGRMVNERKLYDNLNAAADSLRVLVTDIKKNPKKYLTVKVF